MRTMRAVTWCLGLLTMSASLATASPIIIPPGLAAGSTYFLAFVTAGDRDATSSNIADYDAFVTAQANMDPALAALSTSWKVIGSTATVDAITHIAVTGPVFRLDGVKIASDSADMFDGSIGATLSINQYGLSTTDRVWTGSNPYGVGFGAATLGTSIPRQGNDQAMNADWLFYEQRDPARSTHSFYGVSGPLQVPQPVPEPGTIALMFGPALALFGRYRRR